MTIRKRNIVSISTYGSQTYLPEGVFYDNEYDHNGNLLYDEMRETKFRYNHLNLATTITSPDDTLLIQYDAIGNKVRQISKTSTSVDTVYFVGGSIFSSPPAPLSPLWGQGAGEGGSTYKLSYLPLSEGYYSDGEYFAVIHDYLGSVRVVLSVDSNRVKEVNHYGPWGVEYGLSDSPFGIQPFKHQGKERLGVAGFSLHNHGARLADNVMGRWTTRDPLEERDYWNGAYVYCGNNPVRYVDPDGRYFDKANENKASKIEKKAEHKAARLEKQANRLEAKGKDLGDLRERSSELRNSAKDIQDMRGDESTEYRYAGIDNKANTSSRGKPAIDITGKNKAGDKVVTMFTENNMGSKLHESRHGGQNVRGEYDIATGNGYGVADEVSAYRAQYSWDGKLIYRDSPSDATLLDRVKKGQNATTVEINNINDINDINAKMVNSIVDPGFILIYPPSNIPLNIWNSN